MKGVLSGPDRIIEGDYACRRCGYNLRGLPVRGRCPECGTAIGIGRRRRRVHDTITSAPERYLRRLGRFAALTALGGAGMALASALSIFGGLIPAARSGAFQSWMAAVALLSSVLWWLGVWVLTGPREVAPGVGVDPVREGQWVRWGARAGCLGWVLWAALWVVGTRVPNNTLVLVWSEWVRLGAVVGLALAAWRLADLLQWAEDVSLSDHVRGAAFLAVVTSVLVHAWSLSLWITSLSRALVLIAILVYLGYVYSLAMMGWGAVSLSRMCAWAVVHKRERAARDAALKARVEAAQRAARGHG